ncbi:hypothetical protein A3J90_08150 [candidate division WOR-1 bacterium RIFOXYC2_FULL_37_10]|uniref:Uncharacterized protein n=1 Tax=candidate division WOR-1 bacterium RIFOXYB2_FULL_37_13 TaxID=1802579 RepID=A0A1F4SSU6_UNCSA|nr:MAG: hypothetical protein A2310_02800 [candidate division WOR-1 bacterium RIFOXYB2_FULL_37_13]OGC37359.1 MAG: hypothetical protein A3J90_08150 [candidate division WOR-1 bacterium RIFOXYC2_FULL_37_10]
MSKVTRILERLPKANPSSSLRQLEKKPSKPLQLLLSASNATHDLAGGGRTAKFSNMVFIGNYDGTMGVGRVVGERVGEMKGLRLPDRLGLLKELHGKSISSPIEVFPLGYDDFLGDEICCSRGFYEAAKCLFTEFLRQERPLPDLKCNEITRTDKIREHLAVDPQLLKGKKVSLLEIEVILNEVAIELLMPALHKTEGFAYSRRSLSSRHRAYIRAEGFNPSSGEVAAFIQCIAGRKVYIEIV